MIVRVPQLADVRAISHREQDVRLTPDRVLVKHVATAPSIGTALHMYRGEHLAVDYVRETRPFPYPWVQGFAYGVGEVQEVGEQVDGLRKGDLVYSMKLAGEVSALAPADVTPVPAGLDPECAALAFQAGVALHGVKGARVQLGDNALVTGQGPIGIFAAQFCALAGARKVIVSDLEDSHLDVSRQVGVDVAINARREDVPQRVKEATGRGADVVVEASGSPQAILDGSRAAARLARISVTGWVMAPLTVNLAEDFTPKTLELVICHGDREDHWLQQHRRGRPGGGPSQLDPENREFIFELMAAGKLKAKELITHRFPLSEIQQAWEFIDTRQDQYCQVLFAN